jgi:hypothetical protein
MKQNAVLGLLSGFTTIAIAVLGASANGDDYPQRTVTFICPFPAGGGTDILTRMLAQELQDKLKQPVIVENRTGAGTQITPGGPGGDPPDHVSSYQPGAPRRGLESFRPVFRPYPSWAHKDDSLAFLQVAALE